MEIWRGRWIWGDEVLNLRHWGMERKCLLSNRRGWQCPAGPFGWGGCLVCIFRSGRPLGLSGITCYGKWWIIFCRGYMSWFFLDNIYNRLCIFPSNVRPSKMGRKTHALKQLVRNEKQEAQTWRGWIEGADAPFLAECTRAGTWQYWGVISALGVKATTVCASWGECLVLERWFLHSTTISFTRPLWEAQRKQRVGLFLTQGLWFFNSIN